MCARISSFRKCDSSRGSAAQFFPRSSRHAEDHASTAKLDRSVDEQFVGVKAGSEEERQSSSPGVRDESLGAGGVVFRYCLDQRGPDSLAPERGHDVAALNIKCGAGHRTGFRNPRDQTDASELVSAD